MPLEEKLVGGKRPPPELKRCLVSYRHKDLHICTGFLISEHEVLTAAHCLDNFFKEDAIPNFTEYSVSIGLNDDFYETEKSYAIKEVRAHRHYIAKYKTASSNVGLIMVSH